jgi:putative salt-induced outer membrane protein YdiY
VRRAISLLLTGWLGLLVLCLVLCLVLVLVLWPTTAFAQVNTEPLRKRIKMAGYSLLIEGALTGDTGNTQGIQAGGGLGAGLAEMPHLAFVYAHADYSRFNGSTQVSKTFAHARYNYEFTEWLWGELFAQAQSDQFQRLKLRNLVGVGPRFRVLHADTFDVFLGTAFMLERDVIDVAPGAADRRDFLIARSSTYVTAHWDVDPRVVLATTMYVQPAFRDLSNVRLLSETLFTFKITKLLAASVAATVRYDSAPPSNVKTTDTEIKNALSLTF